LKFSLKKVNQAIRTISYLKPIQVAYQLKNRLSRPKHLKKYNLTFETNSKLSFFDLPQTSTKLVVLKDQYTFNFLNLSHTFEGIIDWDYQGYGKLWNYNLQYLDFLKQGELALNLKFQLIEDVYKKLWIGTLPLEPYPASLRMMNVVRFLSCNAEKKSAKTVASFLIAEINYLSRNLEYHLLGNHLLENGFALLMGGHFFQRKEWVFKAERLLYRELEEQTLKDGAHFELSPMYHQIILFRVLEAVNYLEYQDTFRNFLVKIAQAMISWLRNISFKDGSIPHFNDSCNGVAYGTLNLLEIGKVLGIDPIDEFPLKDSGYRKFKAIDFELIADFHGISPSYQPGHAHADTFSICLNHKGKEILVDAGISTYNISPRRDWERSTNAHNTVEVGGISSSEMWAGFRVGRRAHVEVLEDSEAFVRAVHYGYKQLGISVERSISCGSDRIIINETISNLIDKSVFLHLHLHPNINLVRLNDRVFLINGNLRFEFEGEGKVEVENYQFCSGYNQYFESKRFKIEINCCSFTTTITNQ
jgi:uncharacterized heparinase superfamily protein